MFGWDSRASAWTSRWNRSTDSGDWTRDSGSNFTATVRFILRWTALKTRPIPPPPSSSSSVVFAESAVPVFLLGGQDSRLAEGLVRDFVRPLAHPVRHLQHPRPFPQPLGEVRGIAAQFLHAGLLPLLAQFLPAVEEVSELVVVSERSWSFFGQRFAQACLAEPVAGILPATADGPGRHAQHLGCLLMGHLLVPEQIEHFPFLLGQRLDLLVELRPFHRFAGSPDTSACSYFGGASPSAIPRRRVVMAAEPLGSVVPARQVDEDTADLGRRQVVEVPGGLGLDGLQGAVEPGDRFHEHVVGLFPAMDLGVTAKHLPRQTAQPLAGMFDEPLAGGQYRLPA